MYLDQRCNSPLDEMIDKKHRCLKGRLRYLGGMRKMHGGDIDYHVLYALYIEEPEVTVSTRHQFLIGFKGLNKNKCVR